MGASHHKGLSLILVSLDGLTREIVPPPADFNQHKFLNELIYKGKRYRYIGCMDKDPHYKQIEIDG